MERSWQAVLGYFHQTKEKYASCCGRHEWVSLKVVTIAREIVKYKLRLVGVREVRLDRGGTDPAVSYTFYYGNGMTIIN